MNQNSKYSLSEKDMEEIKVHDVMALFHVNREIAGTIIESSKLNGQINRIKKICEEYRKGNK